MQEAPIRGIYFQQSVGLTIQHAAFRHRRSSARMQIIYALIASTYNRKRKSLILCLQPTYRAIREKPCCQCSDSHWRMVGLS